MNAAAPAPDKCLKRPGGANRTNFADMQELTDDASKESLAELVHRALIQAGDMQAAEDKAKEIARRSWAARLPREEPGNGSE